MVILEKQKYDKLVKPLNRVKFNNLFARAVVEKCVSGSVYVDNQKDPKTFYVVHPYGMSLLFGDNSNDSFNASFKNYIKNEDRYRLTDEWLQVYPSKWNKTLRGIFKDINDDAGKSLNQLKKEKVEIYTRINFKFNLEKYLIFKRSFQTGKYAVKRSDKSIFSKMSGSVVPAKFWDNENDFFDNGVGFSLFVDGELSTTAFSAFIHDNKLELGMETLEQFRTKGYAQITCSALIDYCLEKKYEPLWACRLDNTSSYKLAYKLGFIADTNIPYYRLIK